MIVIFGNDWFNILEKSVRPDIGSVYYARLVAAVIGDGLGYLAS
jgi:hypothetical protein